VQKIEQAGVCETDDVLLERARRGDADAYAGLVERYQDVAFRVAYLISQDAEEAKDAAQEAFIKAFYALRRFRAGAPFGPWLLQIVANQARNQRRAGGRRGALALRAFAEERPSGGAAPSPEVAALIDEQRRALLQAVSALRDEDRLVVAYRYFFELSEAEMADALGCARGTIKSRLSRALSRLRQLLPTVGLSESARADAEDADG
jgi:RNA polymerase sigma factor (sigma-70 family)